MMRFPLLLALRFLRSTSEEYALSTMLKICFFSIVLGTGSLTLVAAIMKGFEKATYAKLKGVHADLIIDAQGRNIDFAKLSTVISQEYADTITTASPTSLHHVMLEAPSSSLQGPLERTICILKAIDPITEPRVSSLSSMITQAPVPRWESLDSHSIALGESLAERLEVHLGSPVTLIYQPDNSSSSDTFTLERIQVNVGALFKTGIHDFDEQIIIAPFSLVNQLYPEGITQVSLALTHESEGPSIKHALQERLGLEVFSWKDLYPPLMSALVLERYAMWLILMLVTLVASLTIIALLYMYIRHKIIDIAFLKAMGMANSAIKEVFIWIALLITLSATACGILLAVLCTWLLRTFPFIKLPDVYYVSHLPAQLDGTIILSVALLGILVGLCAGFFPNRSLKHLRVGALLKGMGI